MASLRHVDVTRSIDPDRITEDPRYRTAAARVLLERSSEDTDHVELRRLATQVFPDLARARSQAPLARLVGSAATLRQSARDAGQADSGGPEPIFGRKPIQPLDYPRKYADLDDATRSRLISFCRAELEEEHDGRQALQNIDRYYGWPYSERTFYVGPWKAARLRRRKEEESADRAARG